MSRASKNKGVSGQNEVRDMLVSALSLNPLNVKTAVMGESGDDVKFYGDDAKLFPFSVEVKRTEKTSPWEWITQCVARATTTPYAIFFRRNRSEWNVIVKAETLINLQKTINDYVEQIKKLQGGE